jgi:hypothetical protein
MFHCGEIAFAITHHGPLGSASRSRAQQHTRLAGLPDAASPRGALSLQPSSAERYPLLRCHGVLDGYRMRVEWSRDRSLLYGTYEREVADRMMHAIYISQVVMDVGSNHGFYALLRGLLR